MKVFISLSTVEQLARYLRGEIKKGSLFGELPGVLQLAGQLGVSPKTVVGALQILDGEGVVVNQGAGRCHLVVPGAGRKARGLRLAILPGEPDDARVDYVVELQHRLVEAGHVAEFARKTLGGLKMSKRQVANLVRRTEADGWILVAASRGVIEWFSDQEIPAFALFGRRRGLAIAGIGPDKEAAMPLITRRLVELGHRRIVMLGREVRRVPRPGAQERAFLEGLAEAGLPSGPFNLPAWEETAEGLHEGLDSLFKVTPPTALIVDEPPLFFAVQQYLGGKGIRCPQDVSLICTDRDAYFSWQSPSVAHIRWDSKPWVRRVVSWAKNISQGKTDRRQTLTPVEFVEGGTMGSAPC